MTTTEVSPLDMCEGAADQIRLLAGDGGAPPVVSLPGTGLPIQVVFVPSRDRETAAFTVVAETPEGDLRLSTGGLGPLTGGRQAGAFTTIHPSRTLAGRTVDVRVEVSGDDELEVAARFAVLVAA